MLTNNSSKPLPDAELSYGQLLSILRRRSAWFFGLLAWSLSASLLVTLLAKPKYESQMQLLVEPNYEQGISQDEQQNNFRDAEVDYATQLNLMRSRKFIEKTVDALKGRYPDLEVKEVEENLSLTQVLEADVETKIFEAVYVDSNPQRTKDVLDTLQSIYQEYNLQQQAVRLQRGLQSLDEQLQVVQNNLNDSQNSLKTFRQKQNLINPAQQAEAVVTALNNLTQEQATLQAEYNQTQARYQMLQQQLEMNPERALVASRLSQSSRYQELLNQLQQTELELAQRRAVFADADPSVQVLLEKRQKQLDLLQQEIRRVLGRVPAPLKTSGENLLATGQLGATDQELVGQLAELQASLKGLQARRQTLKQTEQKLRNQVNQFPELIAEFDRLKPQADIEQEVLKQLLQERQELRAELARGGFNWQLVEAAQFGEKISPSPVRNLLLGAVVGLFLGSIAAFVREAMDRVIRTPDAVRKQGNIPLLGVLPPLEESGSLTGYLPFRRSLQAQPLLQQVQQPSLRESLDLIYKNIQMYTEGSPISSLLVTSALPGEGKTILALGLATSAARSHRRVLLIDANLRQPTLHKELEIPNHQGLSTLLQQPNLHPVPVPLSLPDCQIDVLTAGERPSDPVSLLNSSRMRELLTQFETTYDVVIVDSSPILGIVDALQVASVCSGCVVVSRLNQITEDALAQATAMLSSLRLLGIVTTEGPTTSQAHLQSAPDHLLALSPQTAASRNGSNN